MQLRPATMLSQQQQTGVLKAIESPFWSVPLTGGPIDRTAFGPRSQVQIAGYRIEGVQSAGMKRIRSRQAIRPREAADAGKIPQILGRK